MIRLAVFGAMAARSQEIAARLRGARLQSADNISSADQPLSTCDAAVFFGPAPGEALALERFLDAGKHVLVAAEVCSSQERLRDLFDRAIRNKVCLAVVNLDRYFPSRQLIRQQLDAGKLGEPGLVRVHRWEPIGAEEVGAQLRDLDLVGWFFGRRPNLVYAVESSGPVSRQIHLGFPGGGMALLDHVQRLPSEESYSSLSVIGTAGAAYADDHQNMQLVFRGASSLVVRTDEGVLPWTLAIQDFIEAINTDRDLSAQRTAWHNVLAVGEAVQQSLRTRQAVVPEGFI